MLLSDIKMKLPEEVINAVKDDIKELRPAQSKSVNAGVLEGKNVLVCTPTASGKTFIAEMALMKSIFEKHTRGVYAAPLKALATEKFHEFKRKYGEKCKIVLAIGDEDREDGRLSDADLIFCTSEKLDSMLRHRSPWVQEVRVLVVDEIHLLNDSRRGPTLELVITLMRHLIPSLQIVALSATIGNPQELAEWLNAESILDDWRPVPLSKGILVEGKTMWEDDFAK